MPTIVNVTQEEIQTKIMGNWFTFKPGQKRVIHNKEIAEFIQKDRRDSGLAVLPELIGENEEVSPEEFEQRKLNAVKEEEAICEEALNRYVQKYRDVVANNQIHLRRDLEMKNIKADPAVFASSGELAAMRLVAKYQKRAEDHEQQKIDEVKKLMENVNKGK